MEEIHARFRNQGSDGSGVLKIKIAGLEETEKFLFPEVDRLRNSVQEMAKNGGKLDAFQEDNSHLKNLTDRIIHEEHALNVELEVPSEFKVLEEAQILHADNTIRMISMVAGTPLSLWPWCCWPSPGGSFAGGASTPWRMSATTSASASSALPHAARRVPRRLLGGGTRDAYLDLLLTESIDATRTMVLHLARAESVQVVMVTSATAGEGKTSLSTHLAASMARIGLKTLLIDGDLRNPTAHRLFEINNDSGLCELLLGEADLRSVIHPTPVSGLSLLPAGIWDSEVSQSWPRTMPCAIFEQLRKEYDFILVDSSPVLPVADALMIGQVVDAVIFSILCEVSRLPSVYTATQRMAALGVRSLGAIVNGVQGELYVSTYQYAVRLAARLKRRSLLKQGRNHVASVAVVVAVGRGGGIGDRPRPVVGPLECFRWRGSVRPSSAGHTDDGRRVGRPIRRVDARHMSVAELSGARICEYVNRRTGSVVSTLLVCGRPGPVSVHTPEICYVGAGYEVVGARSRYTNPSLPGAAFWLSDFQKPNTATLDRLRYFLRLEVNGSWSVPENPRLTFFRQPALLQLYVIRKLAKADEAIEDEPAVEFLKVFLPQVEKSLFPAS